jgi:Cu2+-exporting ATPase
VPVTGIDEGELLGLASAVEGDSEHPIAKAIVSGAGRRGVKLQQSANFKALSGRGASATVNGHSVAVGGPRMLADAKTAIPAELDKTVRIWESEGQTVLYVLRDRVVIGGLAVEDGIRPESAEAVKALHELGIRVAMITGDSQTVADSVAKRLGIDEVRAQVLPADKASAVEQFQAGGKRVAMVGDGVNDAPALAKADVGIAIGAGTDVAVESAGIVLVRSDPHDVVRAIELSRAAYRKMVQNLVWATVYNVIAIPAAAGMFIRWGVNLPMSVGAIAMNLSTIIVALNAQLLRRVKLAA